MHFDEDLRALQVRNWGFDQRKIMEAIDLVAVYTS